MKTSYQVSSIWGVPIYITRGWIVIFFFLVWLLASIHFPTINPNLSALELWSSATIASVLLFASILLHELGHVYFALQNGIDVDRVTLAMMGGKARLTAEPKTARAEFVITAAGPLINLLLAIIFYGGRIFFASDTLVDVVFVYLGRINLGLLIFNILPLFPLDGGRLIRSILWARTDFVRGTLIAARSGQYLAYGMIAIGIISFLLGLRLGGAGLVFMGWVLKRAAKAHIDKALEKKEGGEEDYSDHNELAQTSSTTVYSRHER